MDQKCGEKSEKYFFQLKREFLKGESNQQWGGNVNRQNSGNSEKVNLICGFEFEIEHGYFQNGKSQSEKKGIVQQVCFLGNFKNVFWNEKIFGDFFNEYGCKEKSVKRKIRLRKWL